MNCPEEILLDVNLIFFFLRPMIVIGGSCDRDHEGLGGFQEFPQVIKPHRFAYI